jgi:CheY-like chemotaxis protein
MTTFLLVEDDPNDVLFVQQAFMQAPACIRLTAVADGLHAMHYLEGLGEYSNRRRYPLPNVILLDLKMPRVNGFEFLEWLRAKAPREHRFIPVLVMSSSALVEDVERAYALGVNSYLVKPVDWYEFKERIKAIGIYWGEHVKKPEGRSS